MRPIAAVNLSRLQDTKSLVTFLMLLVVLVLSSLVGYSSLREVRSNQAQAQNDALRYSREAAFEIDGFLSSTDRMLSTLALSPAVVDQQPASATLMVAELLKKNPEYANVWATHVDGRNYASALPPPNGAQIYVGDRQYFRDAIRTGRMSIESIPDNRQHPTKFAVVMCAPVLGPDGKPNGTVQAGFELLPVQRLLGRVGLPQGSSVTVLDQDAIVVARYPSPEEWVGKSADGTEVWQAAQREGSGTYDGALLNGQKWLAGYTTTMLAPWKVIVGFRPVAAYAGLWEGALQNLGLLAIPALIAIYISWRLGFLALERAERYRTLFESISEGFGLYRVVRDWEGKPADYLVLDINPAGEKILGIPRKKLVGRTIREMGEATEARWAELFGRVAETGEVGWYENYSRERGKWFEVYAFSPGKGLIASLFADVTERKRAEEDRERLLVSEREARRQAEKAVRLRDDFLSIAAHELKTPVTSLRGYAQLLSRQFKRTGTIEPSRVAAAMSQMEEQSGRLKRLTEQLLDVASLDAGRLALRREETGVAALVEGAVVAARQTHPERTFQLRNGAVSPALVDGPRLEQVVTNLLENAVKFSPKRIPIEVSVGTGGPGWVEISVRDYGVGVPEADRDRIFERYYRTAGERHAAGMGIGLFVSRQIVEMHGGSIRCEDAEGGGSRFVIMLPAGLPELGAGGGDN